MDSSSQTARMTRRTGIIAALGALLTGCSATGALNALVPNDSYRVTEGVAYGEGPRRVLDVYQPLAPVAGGSPVIVFFYGGNWASGGRADYRFVGESLASAGAVVLIADYRLYPEVVYPEFVQDSAAAVAWAFANAGRYGGDVARLYVMGHSAGAYNAAIVALDPRWLGPQRARLAGFIGIAGPYDFLPIGNPATQRAFSWPQTPPDSQPIAHAGPQSPRTLLIAANSDSLVDPVRNTGGLAARLKAAGVDVTTHYHDKVSHATVIGAMASPLRFLAPVRKEVLNFVGLNAR
jgi:acetyl esterase/lipase